MEGKTAWLQRTLKERCDAAMPRVRLRSRAAAYWWNENIAQLRKPCGLIENWPGHEDPGMPTELTGHGKIGKRRERTSR